MKKTNLILCAILAVLGSVSAWYFGFKQQNTSLEGYDWHFAVADTANIGKIFIADRKGKTITLTRLSKFDWQLNDKYRAQMSGVNNVLDAISRVDLKYRLPRQAVRNALDDIVTNSVKVEIYHKNGEKLRSFYIGGVDMDGQGTYMMMENSNEPYVTHIPNFIGTLKPRFFTDELDWRDRWIYQFEPEDIKEISMDYPLQTSKSFKISRENGTYKVYPLYSVTPRLPQTADKGLVEAFLTGFKALGAEGFETNYPKKDSVKAVTPFVIMSIKDKNDVVKSLRLHPIVTVDPQGTVQTNSLGTALIERYFAEVSDGDFLMVQHFVFEKTFWAYESFFRQRK